MKKLITILMSITFISLSTAFAQYQVKGSVVDINGESVIGASVLEIGTKNGTSVNVDGTFVLNVASQNSMLEVSFIGYKTIQVAASQASKIVLHEDSELLDEVVVIGYGTVKKTDMTGSIVAIKTDEINRGAVTSPSQMLMGKVSGLLVTPASGTPGESATIRIRGAASLNASNDPLIVIDGVPVTSDGGAGMADPLSTVNPDDIESYTVLKDASATAIYGSRASNGVIIITTKKGTGRGAQVSYSSSYSIKQNTDGYNVMNGDEFRDFLTTTYPDNTKIQSLLGENSIDWQDEVYELGFSTDQNLSVYGTAFEEKLPYRVSLGYNYDGATVKVGDNKRTNLGVNLAPKFLDDHLTINLNFKGIYQKTNWANNPMGSALSFDPTQAKYFTGDQSEVANGYWNWLNADGSANTLSSINPLSSSYDYVNKSTSKRSIGNLQIDYNVHGLEDLTAHVNLGYDLSETDGEKYNKLGSISAMRIANDLYTDYNNYNANTLLEAYLNYSHDFANKQHFDIMGGYSWQHNYVRYKNTLYTNAEERGLEEDLYQVVPKNREEYYLLSFYGRANYSIASKYLFTFTLRDDASSRFSDDNRWGLFPSAAFAWNMEKENFLKDSKVISSMKLRAGWGETGQQDIGSDYYPYLARYQSSTSLTMTYPIGADGSYISTLSPQAYNPNLKWETTTTYNLGLDFGLWNDRLTGTVEGYYRKTSDLLNYVSTSLGSNFSNTVISNIGDMENKGLELSFNVIPIQTKDMNLSIGANVTFQDTKITKLTSNDSDDYLGVMTGGGLTGTGGYTSLYRTDYTPYSFHLYEQLYDANGNAVENGLVDRNDDGLITDVDRYITGYSPTPDAYFGLNVKFSYKQWDAGLNAHGSLGNYVLNAVKATSSTSFSDAYTKGYLDNLNKDYLVEGWTDAFNINQYYSDMFLEDASFFKLDDINVGYSFGLKNSAVRFRVGASVQNVFTITKYDGLDPEITNSNGVDSNIIPRPRLYTIRLNIKF
ncbi:MAG: SusC/RagA family TonB-linked outer membrane protein [Bacteroidales bacterium]